MNPHDILTFFTTPHDVPTQLAEIIVITIGLLGCVASAWFSVRDKPTIEPDWDGDIAPWPIANQGENGA